MTTIQPVLNQILQELNQTAASISDERAASLIAGILAAKRIFVAGAGRSGLAARAFAMRLMHLGFAVHVVGDSTSPSLTAEDLLLIASGSGATGSLVVMAQKAKTVEAQLGLITINRNSPIGELADVVLEIPAPSPKLQKEVEATSIQPMGALFEQTLFLACDALILLLMEKTAENPERMFQRHANLE